MDDAFEGADAFVHSYYIRFPHAGDTFERAVARAGILFERARRAGVRRIVHVSVSNANEASDLPYYRHKGRLVGAERTCSDPGGRPDECGALLRSGGQTAPLAAAPPRRRRRPESHQHR